LAPPTYFVSQHEFPDHYQKWQEQGISVAVSPVLLAKQPLLAGIKHLNRLEQVLIKQQLQQTSFDDVIVCDNEQHIIETSAANLFWRKGSDWYTPDLTGSGVDGVMRNQLLRYFATHNNPATIIQTGLRAILAADEVFICNSLMKVVPVLNIQVTPDTQVIHYKPKQKIDMLNWLSLESRKN
jgi:4-amino-4-deoxychorismate lyase